MTPTKRFQRFADIVQVGCICCRRFGLFADVDIHHLNANGHAGQKRRGDEFTIGLCPWHHRGILPPMIPVGPSLAKEPRRFREFFGSDAELLMEENRLILELRARRVA